MNLQSYVPYPSVGSLWLTCDNWSITLWMKKVSEVSLERWDTAWNPNNFFLLHLQDMTIK